MFEVIIAMSLILLLIILSSRFLSITGLTFKGSNVEYKMQTDMRVTMQYISNKIINATGIFLLSEFDSTNLTDGWNYIGLDYVELNGKKYAEISQYTTDPSNIKNHTKRVIATSNDDITYSIEFINNDRLGEDKNIQVIIYSYNQKTGNQEETIKMTYEASNSIQVIDRGYAYNNAVAMAFKDESTKTKTADANVIMTFDKSKSMLNTMSATNNDIRIDSLKTAANILVDTLSPFDSILIGINLFNQSSFVDNAADKKTFPRDDILYFTSPYTDKDKFVKFIGDILTVGSTNTGDGIRIAYYNFIEQEKIDNANNRNAKKHYILMVDGDSDYCTGVRDDSGDIFVLTGEGEELFASYYTGSEPVINLPGGNNAWGLPGVDDTIYGESRIYEPKTSTPEKEPIGILGYNIFDVDTWDDDRDGIHAREYSKIMAQKMITLKDITPYLVRCGSEATAAGMHSIAEGLGLSTTTHEGTQYFDATDKDQLIKSFKRIATKIAEDLWFVEGPE